MPEVLLVKLNDMFSLGTTSISRESAFKQNLEAHLNRGFSILPNIVDPYTKEVFMVFMKVGN